MEKLWSYLSLRIDCRISVWILDYDRYPLGSGYLMLDTVYQWQSLDSICHPTLGNDRVLLQDTDFLDNIDCPYHHQYCYPSDIVMVDNVAEDDVTVETFLHIDHLACIYYHHLHQSYYSDRLVDNDHLVDSDRRTGIDLRFFFLNLFLKFFFKSMLSN